ncbi:hypothetical protein NC651_017505 [Populus alba x Populus x berolinensis]|nr:hypothetical protein NC651_017505 [Populus alba x Populus x berolinensis]
MADKGTKGEPSSENKMPKRVTAKEGSPLPNKHPHVAQPHEPIQLIAYNGSELQRWHEVDGCLQFEQAQTGKLQRMVPILPKSSNQFNLVQYHLLCQYRNWKILDSSQVELTISSHKEQNYDCYVFSARISGKSPAPIAVSTKPSGIGFASQIALFNTFANGKRWHQDLSIEPTIYHQNHQEESIKLLMVMVANVATVGRLNICFAAGIYCSCNLCLPGVLITGLNMKILFLKHDNKLNHVIHLLSLRRLYSMWTEFQAIDVEDGDLSLHRISGRHKTGCNCKRSMCRGKKLMSRCSNACRCEGCRNIHGRKEEYAYDVKK